jgi:hypothetical protein
MPLSFELETLLASWYRPSPIPLSRKLLPLGRLRCNPVLQAKVVVLHHRLLYDALDFDLGYERRSQAQSFGRRVLTSESRSAALR